VFFFFYLVPFALVNGQIHGINTIFQKNRLSKFFQERYKKISCSSLSFLLFSLFLNLCSSNKNALHNWNWEKINLFFWDPLQNNASPGKLSVAQQLKKHGLWVSDVCATNSNMNKPILKGIKNPHNGKPIWNKSYQPQMYELLERESTGSWRNVLVSSWLGLKGGFGLWGFLERVWTSALFLLVVAGGFD
jgi:hypothetical protein